jgi:hypothetical protein
MGRERKQRLFPVALSIDGCRDALSCPRSRISEAIYLTAELPAYAGSNNSVRILVVDLVEWVRTWPRATAKREYHKRKHPHADED